MKRLFDVVGAIGGLIFFALPMAGIAAAVLVLDGRPILFRQPRLGRGRRRFTILKFRSMRDGEVTAVGRVLRATGLDELPQLVNVLKGDMNIVGPRPERPSIFMQLRKEIDRYQMRQRAKPGITGWAQINQNYDTSIDDVRRKVEYDLAYIERRSVVEDMRIMAKTLPVMFFRKGAH